MTCCKFCAMRERSPSSRRAWIEIFLSFCSNGEAEGSPSSRRAWIEIGNIWSIAARRSVALLAEGVDRNDVVLAPRSGFAVALLAEGVDRNLTSARPIVHDTLSPSSRRAWIEILCWKMSTTAALVALLAEGVDRNWKECGKKKMWLVALLAEGVDRNTPLRGAVGPCRASPSSRRAWIEILLATPIYCGFHVALLAEGVDRNLRNLRHKDFNPVALLAEGVDRNMTLPNSMEIVEVALLAEGVDRNTGSTTSGSRSRRRPPRGGRG